MQAWPGCDTQTESLQHRAFVVCKLACRGSLYFTSWPQFTNWQAKLVLQVGSRSTPEQARGFTHQSYADLPNLLR
jgi:hypothetical protein